MAEGEEKRWERPKRSSAKAGLAWIAILALLGLVIWLASERNARQWFLVPEDGQLVVKRGVLFPVGRQSFKTDDPRLSEAYAPLTPPPGAALPEERAFDDEASLDQALYEQLARWAREDIATERPDLLPRALGYLARADKLAGLSATQRDDLRALRAESGFYEARGDLERGAEALRAAREKLRAAAASPTRHAAEASALLRRVEPLVDEAFQASRQAAPQRAEAAAPPRPPPAASADGGTPATP